jgi:septal ring factor EnvC (AmiA/AmiB activator)
MHHHEAQALQHQQHLAHKNDLVDQLSSALSLAKRGSDQHEARQAELNAATDYILGLEEKVYKANKTALELLKQLKDSEVEIKSLKSALSTQTGAIVYIPVKQDPIDKKLAEFLNNNIIINYPERAKLKIMFTRQSEGVYQFGTKRVAVKLEKDGLKVRVGGGFLSIDEFLD